MQINIADFSKIPILLNVTVEALESLKNEDGVWVSQVESSLKNDHHIVVEDVYLQDGIRSAYHTQVAIPYLKALLKVAIFSRVTSFKCFLTTLW